jgi:hypothetical protein
MAEHLTADGIKPIDTVKPVQSDVDVTEQHFQNSLRAIDNLAVAFDSLGAQLANRKKKSNLRILKAILFESEETEKTFGAQEKKMLDICRAIMYHRQIIEIFLMKNESQELLKELNDGEG